MEKIIKEVCDFYPVINPLNFKISNLDKVIKSNWRCECNGPILLKNAYASI